MSDLRCPCARREGIVTETIGDELILYDTATHRAHSLNDTSARVWNACDGTRTADQIAAELQLPADVVTLALVSLQGCDLLTDTLMPSVATRSRREILRRVAVTGAALTVAMPVIRSITAPTPALAATGGSHGSQGTHCVGRGQRNCAAGSSCSFGSTCQPGPLGGFGAPCRGNNSCSFSVACHDGLCGSSS